MNDLFNLVFISASVRINGLIEKVLLGELTDISAYVDQGGYIASIGDDDRIKGICVRTQAGIVTFYRLSDDVIKITAPDVIKDFVPNKLHVNGLSDYFGRGLNDPSGFIGYINKVIDSK